MLRAQAIGVTRAPCFRDVLERGACHGRLGRIQSRALALRERVYQSKCALRALLSGVQVALFQAERDPLVERFVFFERLQIVSVRGVGVDSLTRRIERCRGKERVQVAIHNTESGARSVVQSEPEVVECAFPRHAEQPVRGVARLGARGQSLRDYEVLERASRLTKHAPVLCDLKVDCQTIGGSEFAL